MNSTTILVSTPTYPTQVSIFDMHEGSLFKLTYNENTVYVLDSIVPVLTKGKDTLYTVFIKKVAFCIGQPRQPRQPNKKEWLLYTGTIEVEQRSPSTNVYPVDMVCRTSTSPTSPNS